MENREYWATIRKERGAWMVRLIDNGKVTGYMEFRGGEWTSALVVALQRVNYARRVANLPNNY